MNLRRDSVFAAAMKLAVETLSFTTQQYINYI